MNEEITIDDISAKVLHEDDIGYNLIMKRNTYERYIEYLDNFLKNEDNIKSMNRYYDNNKKIDKKIIKDISFYKEPI